MEYTLIGIMNNNNAKYCTLINSITNSEKGCLFIQSSNNSLKHCYLMSSTHKGEQQASFIETLNNTTKTSLFIDSIDGYNKR
jgi:hypothetical protein